VHEPDYIRQTRPGEAMAGVFVARGTRDTVRPRMFKKILIANRGEIACRVIRTARRMGIKTVAVHSEADADALHVEMADEAVAIGPAPSAESYLVIDRIVAAAKDTKAQAIHPGYGFLSENPAFAKALEKAEIAFIGPPIKAIKAMGDKIASKKLAAKAGVSTIPGHMDLIADAGEAVKIARDIGYPVMIKASAGGGGKGMRIARNDAEAKEGFASARNEAKSSFADDRIFIEKFIEEPRHIEIQVLADAHGNVIHLGERECSIQRRHQKVIEEAPSPFLDEATRAAMGAQAVALAQAVGYHSAGTVEFIADKDRNFYFLEMNTRLQVEHPVTEFVTGLDLVEQMIRIADGQKLGLGQGDVSFDGWAIETRIYAEDPFRGFLPSTGRLVRFRPPAEDHGVRVDAGVGEGGEISMFYDPMIAKLITHGPDRESAAERMQEALDGFYIRGLNHNISFLSALIAHPRFREGRLSTEFIAEEYPDGFTGEALPREDPVPLAAVAAAVHRCHTERDVALTGVLEGHERYPPGRWAVMIGGHVLQVVVVPVHDGFDLEIDGRHVRLETDWELGEGVLQGRVDGVALTVQIDKLGTGYRLFHGGSEQTIRVVTPRTAELAATMPVKPPPDTSQFLLSPMPGLLSSIAVEPGREIKAGEVLAVVEAMKMENVLRAERDGTVKKLHADPGDSLAVDQIILEFE
jgi:propionyl-CoA carboxylase alpha chain